MTLNEALEELYNRCAKNDTAYEAYCTLKKAVQQEPCEDYISRQAVLDLLRWRFTGKELYKAVYDLPSVTPAEMVGHWIEKEDPFGDTFYNCSACGESWSTIDGEPWNNGMKYCPNCGAKMEVGENG